MKDQRKISISKGNSKLKGIPNISTEPIASCPPDAPCVSRCYAMKSFNRWHNVEDAWSKNLSIYRKSPDSYFAQINEYIHKHKPERFRFHVGGDIPDQGYVDRMFTLARIHPYTSFLAFTKRYYFNYDNRPDNFAIVFSAWPGFHMPDEDWAGRMPIAWLFDLNNVDKRLADKAQGSKGMRLCMEDCTQCRDCWDLKPGEDIVFLDHYDKLPVRLRRNAKKYIEDIYNIKETEGMSHE